MTSMDGGFFCPAISARNPQRRSVMTLAAGRRVPTQGMPTAPGRFFDDPAPGRRGETPRYNRGFIMKRLSVLGSTGSIGHSALDVVEAFPDRYQVVALAAGRSVETAGGAGCASPAGAGRGRGPRREAQARGAPARRSLGAGSSRETRGSKRRRPTRRRTWSSAASSGRSACARPTPRPPRARGWRSRTRRPSSSRGSSSCRRRPRAGRRSFPWTRSTARSTRRCAAARPTKSSGSS